MGNSHFNMKYENFIDNGLTHLIKLIHTIFFFFKWSYNIALQHTPIATHAPRGIRIADFLSNTIIREAPIPQN